eukprot:GILI01006009.1.p1 GENE.GILI01006009.1~~GILI01006009.1.p1  ORF type:complete len:298 (+),score=83.91 GILI01006009.1:111-1004(+)
MTRLLNSLQGISAAVLIALAALATTASAYDFGCQDQWSGPSTNNDVWDCAQEFPNEKPGLIIPMAIPLFFFVVLLIAFPVVFLGRCCGVCGSNNQRPGADCCCDGDEWDAVDDKEEIAAVYHSKPGAITCVKCTIFLLLLLSVAAVVLLPIGASMTINGWQDALDRVDTDIIDWLQVKRDDLMASLRNPDGGANRQARSAAAASTAFEPFLTPVCAQKYTNLLPGEHLLNGFAAGAIVVPPITSYDQKLPIPIFVPDMWDALRQLSLFTTAGGGGGFEDTSSQQQQKPKKSKKSKKE